MNGNATRMTESETPDEIIVFVYWEELPHFEHLGKVLRVSDHAVDGVVPTSYTLTSIHDAHKEATRQA